MNWVTKNWRGLLVLALGLVVLGATHYVLNSCEDVGRLMKTSMGTEVPMRCSWTERAVEGMGGLVAGFGLFMLLAPGFARALSLAAGFTGVLMFVTPIWLIPTCADAMMTCNLSLKPGTLLLAALITVVGLAGSLRIRTFEGRRAMA